MAKYTESQSELFNHIQSQMDEQEPALISNAVTNIGMIFTDGSEHSVHRILNMWDLEIRRNGDERDPEEMIEDEQWDIDWDDIKKILEGGEAEEKRMMAMEVEDCVEDLPKEDGKENLAKIVEEEDKDKSVEEKDEKVDMVPEENLPGSSTEKLDTPSVEEKRDEVVMVSDGKKKTKIMKHMGKPNPPSARAERAAIRRYKSFSEYHIGKNFLVKQAKAARNALPPKPKTQKKRGRPPKTVTVKK